MSDHISPRQFRESAGVEDWRVISDGAVAYFRTTSFAESARFVQAIAQLPGIAPLRPDVDVRDGLVAVRVITYEGTYRGMSQRDVDFARDVSAAARKLGLEADPSKAQSVLIIPGAPDIAKVMPFWEAVLGYERRKDSPSEDLVDSDERGPAFWFEQMKSPRGDGGGAIHICVWVPYEQAQARIAAALAAGGRMVRADFAPSWWTLADAFGNEADIATTQGRD